MHGGVKYREYAAWCVDVGRATRTVELDTVVARRFELLGGCPIDVATPAHVDAWWQALRGAAPQTRATYLRAARRYWRWAAVRGGPPDPSAHLTEPRVPRRLPRPVPERDVALLLAVVGGDVRVQLGLAAYCGLRVSEIARLAPRDVFTDTTGGRWLLVHGKGGRERTVPVCAVVDDLLAGYSWPATNGRALSVTLRRVMHELGLPYSAHQLRHSFATAVLAADRNVVTVQRLLGHASVATTMVYADVSADQLQAAVAAAFDVAGAPVTSHP